jgi:hypothetical protein
MDISSYVSTKNNTPAAIGQIMDQINADHDNAPSWLYITYTCTHDQNLIACALSETYPQTSLHGTSSCSGVMTQKGHANVDDFALAVFAVFDNAGSYGTGACEYADGASADDIDHAVNIAMRSAMSQAGREGEAPTAVWLHTAPGHEEDILIAISNIIGHYVPVVGGSSGDNTMSGQWSQIANQKSHTNAISLSVLYPSCKVAYQFHSGHKPTIYSGFATRCDGRVLYEIDDQPAAEVYNQWTEGILADDLGHERPILAKTTLFPLGRVAGYINNVAQYTLSHPGSISPDGSISLFTDVTQGERLHLMSGTIDSLINRASRVVNSAIELARADKEAIKGALVIYCAGCLLTVGDKIDEVSQGLNVALNNQPFVGAYTLGEQGCFEEGVNMHGNLMISALVFL